MKSCGSCQRNRSSPSLYVRKSPFPICLLANHCLLLEANSVKHSSVSFYKYIIPVQANIYISYLCPLKNSRNNDNPGAMSMLSMQILFLEQHSPLKKQLIPGRGQRKYKMSLEHLIQQSAQICLKVQEPVGRGSLGPIWEHVNIQINNDRKGL